MTNIAIRASHLSKCYHIYNTPHDRLKQFVAPRLQRMIGLQPKQYFHEFWALNDVSFEIKKGETVGIIGRNGSGKSTLLQLLCGTLTPTHGQVEIHGRVAALLELGSGFNPEFTGRENVYMNAAVLGLSHQEVEERFDDIAAFADIGEFIEHPVKTYSSGMFVRLAFAVNILSKPDIMIVDEALAVGDMNFQAKCMTALTRIQDNGATVLFVSHDVGAVKSLCSRGIYLEHGTVKIMGNAPDVADQYMRIMREEMNAGHIKVVTVVPKENINIKETTIQPMEENGAVLKQSDEFDKRVKEFRYGSGGVRVTYVQLLNMSNEPILFVAFNQEVKIRIYIEASTEQSISVNFYIFDDKKINITGCGFNNAGHEYFQTDINGIYLVEYDLRLPLHEGNYSVQVQVVSPRINHEIPEFLDVIENTVIFQMERYEPIRIWSKVYLFPTLSLKRLPENAN